MLEPAIFVGVVLDSGVLVADGEGVKVLVGGIAVAVKVEVLVGGLGVTVNVEVLVGGIGVAV